MRSMPTISWRTKVLLTVLLTSFPAAAAAAPPEVQVLERKDLPGGLVRERLRLPGFDPDEAVPAIAIHPASGGPFPVCITLHSFRGAKENLESWCRDLAARGIFAVTIDAHLHGERTIAGVFHGDNIASLGGEYSIWVHQMSIARTAKDIPVILDALAGGPTSMPRGWRRRGCRWEAARPWSSPGGSPVSASWRASSAPWTSGGT